MIIKTPWRLIIEILLCLALIMVSAAYLRKSGVTQQKNYDHAKAVIKNPVAKPIATYKDNTGATHTQVSAVTGDIPQKLLKDTSATNRTMLDSAAKKMRIKDKQILELTRENLTIKAENIQLKAVSTAPGNTLFNYSDPWLQLQYNTANNQANLQYHVNITTGKFTPASWLPFSHKPAVLDFSADDKRATINNVQHLTTIIPEPWLGFTASVDGYYDVTTKQITPAATADLRLGRWHIEDNFYYNQRLKQAIGLKYDLIKIH